MRSYVATAGSRLDSLPQMQELPVAEAEGGEVSLAKITDNLWIDLDEIIAIKVDSNGRKTKWAEVVFRDDSDIRILRTKDVDALIAAVSK